MSMAGDVGDVQDLLEGEGRRGMAGRNTMIRVADDGRGLENAPRPAPARVTKDPRAYTAGHALW